MKRKSYILASVFLLFALLVKAEQVDTVLHFNPALLTLDTLTAPDGNTYTRLFYPHYRIGDEVGAPSLPVNYIRMTLPFNAKDIELHIEYSGIESQRALDCPVYPKQKALTYSLDNAQNPFVLYKSSVYAGMGTYPKELSKIHSITRKRNGEQNVTFAVYPIKYNLGNSTISFYTSYNVSITYNLIADSHQPLHTEKATTSVSGLPHYKYCVVTSRDLEDSFTRLIAWKRQKGIDAGVVCIEDIINNPVLQEGHGETNNIIEPGPYTLIDAGTLRNYLRESVASSAQTEYVLLGGDYTIIPIRYAMRNDTLGVGNEELHIPSDWYYSELGGNWHRDSYQMYTEDFVDNADVSVGRLLCRSTEDVENYTDKLLRYEINPGNGKSDYLRKALYFQADEALLFGDASGVANATFEPYADRHVLSELPSYDSYYPTSPTGSDLIDSINNHFGFLSFYTHGNPYFVQTMSRSINNANIHEDEIYRCAITSQNGIDTLANMHLEQEYSNGLNDLQNKDYPMPCFSASCTSMPFDCDDAGTGYYLDDSIPNIGKSYTSGKDYGGPTYIGCTRLGLVDWSHRLQILFNKQLRNLPVAKALNKAKMDYIDETNWPYSQYLLHTTNLLGCPEIYLWTDSLRTFNVSREDNRYIYVNNEDVLPFDSAKLIKRSISDDYPYTLETVKFWSPLDNYIAEAEYYYPTILTFIGKNFHTKILPLYIYYPQMTGKHYLFTKGVVCEGKKEGINDDDVVVFDENADYTFENCGTFRINKNVKIENGAQFRVIPSKFNFE